MGQVPVGNWRDRIDVSCGRGTRSLRFQAKVEGGRGSRPCELFVSIPGMRRGGILRAWLGADAKLARGRSYVDDLGGGCLRGDARIWLQQNGVRKNSSRRMFRHRPWDGGGARSDFCTVHVQDTRVSRRRGDRVFHSPLADSALFQIVWKPTVGARNQVPAVVPVGNGSACELG